MSIPKRSPAPAKDRDEEGKHSAKHAVHNELRALEIFYLCLTVLSPFVGAILLRYVSTSISGDKSTLSWFSTTLFVLATGIRPWSHLVERLKDRSQALNTVLEEMEDAPEETTEVQGVPEEQTVVISGKVDELRRRIDRMDFRVADMSNTNMSEWDDLADAIDSIDDAVKKLRAESTKKEQAQEARLDTLEAYVLGLQYANRTAHPEPSPFLAYLRGQQLRALFWEVVALPWSVTSLLWAVSARLVRDAQRVVSPRTKTQSLPPQLKTQAKVKFAVHGHGHSRPGNGSAVRAPMLEPILEEEAPRSDEDQTLVGEPATMTNFKISQTQTKDRLDPLVRVISQVILFILSPAIFIAKCCITIIGFPVRVFRAVIS